MTYAINTIYQVADPAALIEKAPEINRENNCRRCGRRGLDPTDCRWSKCWQYDRL